VVDREAAPALVRVQERAGAAGCDLADGHPVLLVATDALATVDAAHTRSPCTAPAAFIEYACGLVVLDDGVALVSMGLQDISTVFVWAQQDHWATPDAPPVDLAANRFTYCDGVIPTVPYALTGTPTLCLNMIVKNESRIIERQLATVTPILDAYCICDTGSTDDTVARIHRYFERAGIPGRVVQHPFVNFGHNRSVALRAAQDLAEYTLLLDADMKLVIDQGFDKTQLTKDVYTVEQGSEAFSYRNVRLLRTSIGATCVGATHEYYGYADTCSTGHLTTLRIDDVGDGGCKANKFERDIRLLTADVEADPGNGRAHFYLANSYKDTQQWTKAVAHYTKRIELGGWYEEVWYSYYALGKCYQAQGEHAQAVETWLQGYNHYPKRSENLYEIVKHYRETGKSELASRFYRWAAAIPEPRTDALFLHHDVYQYLLTYEFTVFYYYLQDKSAYPPDAIHRALFAMLHYDHNLCNVLCNYQFYARALKDAPGTAITRLTHTVETALPDGFPRATFDDSTPAACVLKGGDTLTNVRYNNTVIDDAWGYHMREAREVTHNVWVRTGATGAVVASGWMRDPTTDAATDASDRFAGRQAVRLLARRDGTVVYTATVCGAPDDTIDANVTSAMSKVFRIEYGVYDTTRGRFEGTTMRSPTQAECEKNWCLFETPAGDLKCVYSWFPFVVGRLESDTFVEESRSTEAKVLRRARGSSHGVPHGDALWFLVHLVSYETPRRYYHAVVVTDTEGTRVERVSYPFTLEGEPIEYCGSLSVDDTHLTLHYSVKDAAARSMRVPQAAVRWGYRVAGEAREAVREMMREGKVGSQQVVVAV